MLLSLEQSPYNSPSPLAKSKNIVLAGNPNVGKSVIFNALTGKNTDVSNYPGTTIDVYHGKTGSDQLWDTPGVYGISSLNDEERTARSMILDADVIVNVISALSLDRDLFLTLQLIDFGKPLLLVVNQWDEAEQRGVKINLTILTEVLGVPVVKCIAVAHQGISNILTQLDSACPGQMDEQINNLISPLINSGIPQEHAVLMLEQDELSISKYGAPEGNLREQIYKWRRAKVNTVVEQVVSSKGTRHDLALRLGNFLLHPIYGLFIGAVICYLIFYQLLGILIAGNLVDFTEKKLMRQHYEPAVRRLVAMIFPSKVTIGNQHFNFPQGTIASGYRSIEFDKALLVIPSFTQAQYNFWAQPSLFSLFGQVLAGPYGILTLTITYLVGLLMPLVLGFYLGLSLLEDSGYLPRLAVLVDQFMSKIGLNGRAIIPLILGLGCVTMATITTRLLSSKREKIIATALLGVAIPCSAQLGVVSGMLAHSGGLLSWAVYVAIIGGILALTGLLLNMVLPGKSGALMIDLPPLRFPRWSNVLKKTWKKSWHFLIEATKPFMLAALIVSLADVTGLLNLLIAILKPIIVGWLGLPNDPRIATTFILGIVRRDFGAFGLTDVNMSTVQALTAMIVVTLFVPCIATVGIMIKERGPKIALTIWTGSWLAAFTVGAVLARLLPPLFHLIGAQ